MHDKSCFFTGHRIINFRKKTYVRARLSQKIMGMINSGVTTFICGGALGFDTLSAQMVLSYKEIYPNIRLHLYLPCRDQTKGWREEDVITYNTIFKKADKVKYICDSYVKGCMQKRNRAMADAALYAIAYLEKNNGGTYFTVSYAQNAGVKVDFI